MEQINFNAVVRLERLDDQLIKSIVNRDISINNPINYNLIQRKLYRGGSLASSLPPRFLQSKTYREALCSKIILERKTDRPSSLYEKIVALSPEDHMKVDSESKTGCNFKTGARVLAKRTYGKNKIKYSAGNVIGRDSSFSRYRVKFSDGAIDDIESDHIVALSQLNIDDPCPDIANAKEWHGGVYEMYNTVKRIKEKVHWRYLVIDPVHIVKAYFCRNSRNSGIVAKNNTSDETTMSDFSSDQQHSQEVIVVKEISNGSITRIEPKQNIKSFFTTAPTVIDAVGSAIDSTSNQQTINTDLSEEPAAQQSEKVIVVEENCAVQSIIVDEIEKRAASASTNALLFADCDELKTLQMRKRRRKTTNNMQWLKCVLCERKFPHFSTLKKHLYVKHKVETSSVEDYILQSKNFICEINNSLKSGCFSNFVTIRTLVSTRRRSRKKRKIKCSKCYKTVVDQPLPREYHVLRHIQRETDIKWLFQCLQCPEGDTLLCRTMNYVCLRRHFMQAHPDIKMENGVHYSSKYDQALPIIEQMVKLCFGKYQITYKESTNEQITPNPPDFESWVQFCKNVVSAVVDELHLKKPTYKESTSEQITPNPPDFENGIQFCKNLVSAVVDELHNKPTCKESTNEQITPNPLDFENRVQFCKNVVSAVVDELHSNKPKLDSIAETEKNTMVVTPQPLLMNVVPSRKNSTTTCYPEHQLLSPGYLQRVTGGANQSSQPVDAVKCNMCRKTVKNIQYSKVLHCLHHLREKYVAEENLLFKCLHCQQSCPTIKLIQFHLRLTHRNKDPCRGVDFEYKSKSYTLQMESLMTECFVDPEIVKDTFSEN